MAWRAPARARVDRALHPSRRSRSATNRRSLQRKPRPAMTALLPHISIGRYRNLCLETTLPVQLRCSRIERTRISEAITVSECSSQRDLVTRNLKWTKKAFNLETSSACIKIPRNTNLKSTCHLLLPKKPAS